MTEAIDIVDVAPRLAVGLFFLAISLALGVVVYIIMRRPETRRPDLARLGAARRSTALVVGGLTAVAIFGAIVASLFTGFRRIDVEDGQLRLVYWLPLSAVVIQRADVQGIETRRDYRGSWRVAIVDKSGRAHVSGQSGRPRIEEIRDRLTRLAPE